MYHWCKFCSLKNKCRALAEKQLELAKYEFADPELMTDEEVADVLKRVEQLVNWANGVKEYALKQAIETINPKEVIGIHKDKDASLVSLNLDEELKIL